MNDYYVYKHTNNINGKVYIGCSRDPYRISCQSRYTPSPFASAIKKYGWHNFSHEILYSNLSQEEAFQKEIETIAFYQSNNSNYGYNRSIGGKKSSLGFKQTDEAKRKISEAMKEINKGREFSPEHKQHLKENHADFRGTKSPLSKLTQSQVDEIRATFIPYDKKFGRNALAKKYGVCKVTIQNIVHNHTYK